MKLTVYPLFPGAMLYLSIDRIGRHASTRDLEELLSFPVLLEKEQPGY